MLHCNFRGVDIKMQNIGTFHQWGANSDDSDALFYFLNEKMTYKYMFHKIVIIMLLYIKYALKNFLRPLRGINIFDFHLCQICH